MRVQWRRKQIFIAVATAMFLSTLGLLKYATYFEEEVHRYIRRQLAKNSGSTYEIYKVMPNSSKQSPTLHKKVMKGGIYQNKQNLLGSLLDKRGVISNITTNISSELVFAFSPTAEELFSTKLVDPNHEQKVYANSPAMLWDGKKFVVVMRMWLDKEHNEGKTKNVFSDNYLYLRTYNEKMEALDVSGKMLGIPTRIHESIGDGPIEPRTFPFYNQIYLSFNAAVYVGKKQVDTTIFWDWAEDRFVMPKVTDGQPQFKRKVSLPRDKHWSPYEFNYKNYMVYSFDPLRILSCNRSATCEFTQNAAPPNYQFNDLVDCVRGGTPTVQYRGDFYITIVHSTLFRGGDKRYYTFNLLVLKANANSKHKVIYFSEPINFHKELMTTTPIIRSKWIEDPFFFPVSLLLEDEDNIIIGGHINDHSAYLFRVKGIKSLMDKVIAQSSTLENDGPANGVLHELAREFAAKQSGYIFQT